MSEVPEHKLQKMLDSWPHGGVATTKWLASMGIYGSLLHKYKTSGWVKPLYKGAYYRPRDIVRWFGAVEAIQSQLDLKLYVGGKTALEYQGHGHFINMGRPTVDLFLTPGKNLPRWFSKTSWVEDVRVRQVGLIAGGHGFETLSIQNISIVGSSRERAAFELLHLSPQLYDFDEVRIIMESLGTLRPDMLIELMENCSSEKAKRLILYFGDVMNHSWRKYLDDALVKTPPYLLKIVEKNGHYNAKYNLFIPKEYVIKNDEDIRF